MITTIITTYHRPLLLKRAVESVLSQTYPNFRVCVYDNGSDAETLQIMQEFVEKDSRIQYHRHPENIGMMANYKYGYDRIETRYFSFLSDDDYLLPNFYETALRDYEKFPDAGFVACRVIAYNENQEIVGDVISRWEREGYYQAPNGLIEMLKSNGRFPIPTGVLLQHSVIKDVSPDWRKEVQLMWDPDYLLQIAAVHPFVINKETCAIYCAHAQAFSTEYYMDVFDSTKNLHVYMTATQNMHQKIITHHNLNKSERKTANQSFIDMVAGVFNIYLYQYCAKNKYRESLQAIKMYRSYYGINKQMFTLMLYPLMGYLYAKLPIKMQAMRLCKLPFKMIRKLISSK